jgi:RND superfamily putative drug exporter
LSRLATWIHARSRLVLFVAVIGAAIAGAVGASVAKHLSPYGAEDPATQSVQAKHRFERAAGRQLDAGVVALVTPGAGEIRSPAAAARVRAVASELTGEPDVARVLTYYDLRDPAMVSRDGRSTYVLAYFKPIIDKRLSDDAKRIERDFAAQHDVKLGGIGIASTQVNAQVSHDLAHAELLAFPFIFILSLLFFRSLVAALLPPLLGGLSIVCTFFALRLLNNFVDLSVFAVNFVTGLGLGLAIDYSLFVVSRYREEAAKSGFGVAALRRTLETAGRTVLFSSITVAAAVAAMAIFPQRFLYSMGLAGAIVALLAASLALIVLPALLALLGPRVNALAPKRLRSAAERDARVLESGFWYRLSRLVMRRPAQIAIASAVLLIAVGIPFTGAKFITVDATVLPASSTARQVDNALQRDFPPNRTAPLELVVGAPASSSQLRALAARIKRLPDVAAVAPARPAGPTTSLLAVAPVRSPFTDSTQRLVRDVRALHEPYYVGVAGQAASFVDLKQSLGAHLPAVIGVVVGSTLIVLFLMTGSVLLPIKAVIMNGLSLSAVFGILVLIFQDGRLQDVLSYHGQGALEITQPIFLFAVGFGLATDYGVFLLSRIKEARDAGVSNREAVAVGLERTGRIVTAAAVLFAVAIGAFATSQIVFIKELGLGAALAVLIDASIIRALLVPSLMELLGNANWWAPAPLRRLHARIGLRERAPAPTVAASAGSGS